VETDDPRWIESERAIMLSFDAETDAACVLVSICPTTMAGIIALLRYANRPIRTGKCGRPNSLPMTGPKPVHGITSLLSHCRSPARLGVSMTGPDPIFARIATHKKLTADWQRLHDQLD
jgi:hypothetical protein